MKTKPYPQYKDSGIEWIGEIPSHWTINLIQECYEYRSEKVSDKYFPPLSVTKNGVVPQLENAAKTDAHDNRKKVLKGDFAINSRSDRKGSCGVSDYDGSVSLIYHVLKPRNKQIENFSHSLFKDVMFSEEFYKWGHGIVDDLWTTQYSEMKKISIPIPPFDEIDIISKNLDKITKNLNKQIEKNKQLITLLKEKRTTLINQTVTKGLNPDVPMKESGIKWIGKIPEHWEINKLKFHGKILGGHAFKSTDFVEEGIKTIKITNIQSMTFNWEECFYLPKGYLHEYSEFKIEKNDIVFALTRPIISTGIKVAIYNDEIPALLNQRTGVFKRSRSDLISKFFYYVIYSDYFKEDFKSKITTTNQPNISPIDLGEIRLIIPNKEEQNEIVEYLNFMTEKINKAIQKIERNIELLEEYKESLIHHVVTGKIDVRCVEVY